MDQGISRMEEGDEGPNSGSTDRFLPVANIARLMKRSLPPSAKIAKDAKEGMQECVSEFISFVTSEASDRCRRDRRKTVNGDDLLWAMATLGFQDFIPLLQEYLLKFRDAERTELKATREGGTAG